MVTCSKRAKTTNDYKMLSHRSVELNPVGGKRVCNPFVGVSSVDRQPQHTNDQVAQCLNYFVL